MMWASLRRCANEERERPRTHPNELDGPLGVELGHVGLLLDVVLVCKHQNVVEEEEVQLLLVPWDTKRGTDTQWERAAMYW
jgi:hypothetical protein